MKREYVLLHLENDNNKMNLLCESRKTIMSSLRRGKTADNTTYRELLTGEIIKPSNNGDGKYLTYSDKPTPISTEQALLLYTRIRDLALTAYITHIYENKSFLSHSEEKIKVLK